jgi:hypothetical protein
MDGWKKEEGIQNAGYRRGWGDVGWKERKKRGWREDEERMKRGWREDEEGRWKGREERKREEFICEAWDFPIRESSRASINMTYVS